MEAPQTQPTELELVNRNGAYAEIKQKSQFGPTLVVTTYDDNPQGHQYITFEISYGQQTVSMSEVTDSWVKRIRLFQIRTGAPNAATGNFDKTPPILRLERRSTVEGSKLVPVLMSPSPSIYENDQQIPARLPVKIDLLSIANVLEDQAKMVGQAINEGTPPEYGHRLLGETLHRVNKGLNEKGFESDGKPIERVFNAPPVSEIVEFIRQEASKLED